MKSEENEKKKFLGKLRGKCKESAREREWLETERVFILVGGVKKKDKYYTKKRDKQREFKLKVKKRRLKHFFVI